MGFATGLQAGANLVSSDIVQMIGLKKEKKRAGKLIEEFKIKLEEYQLSGDELSYYEKIQLSVLANQIGSDYAKSLDELNTSQSSFDKEKMSQEYQTLRNKNDLLATLIKEMKDNKYLSQADLSALDEITGISFSKLWNKETIDGIRNEETKQQTLDNVFGVAKELPTEYTMPYMAGQGVEGLEGLQPTPKEPAALSAKDNWAIDHYNLPEGSPGKISFDQLSKYMGTLIEPEKATALEQKIGEAKQYGATNEEIKNMIVGGTAGGAEKPRATSLSQLEKYRDLALNADSLEDMQSVIDDYKEAGYNPAPLEEKANKEAWVNSQKEYLSNLLKDIKATVNEKGWLKTGEITPQEVSNQIDKNAPAPEVYEEFRKEYMKYRDLLEKAGVDVSQFPKLKALSEIEKVGGWEGVKTFGGVSRGQYKSIYY